MKKKYVGEGRDKYKIKKDDVFEMTKRQNFHMGFPLGRYLIVDLKKQGGKELVTARKLDVEWDHTKGKKFWRDNETEDNVIEFFIEGEMAVLLWVYPEKDKGEAKVHKSKGEQ